MNQFKTATQMREDADDRLARELAKYEEAANDMFKVIYDYILEVVARNPRETNITFNPGTYEKLYRMSAVVSDIVIDKFKKLEYRVDVKSTRTVTPFVGSPTHRTITISWER